MTPGEKIDALRLRLAARNDSRWSDERIEYLAATNLDGRFHLSFFGDPFGDSYRDLLATLRDPEIAECIRSLVLAGPDVGSNGTKNWDIEPLLGGSTLFSAMETFTIQLHQPGHHNHPVVASTYDENGAIAKLLERSPQLRHLTVPSAPDESFFALKDNRIEHLNVDAGFDTQNFILHLGRFHSLPCLRSLEWGEFNESYMENWKQYATPVADYKVLVQSPQFETVKRFVWRNPACSDAEIREIAFLCRDLSPLIVRHSATHLSWNHRLKEWSEV